MFYITCYTKFICLVVASALCCLVLVSSTALADTPTTNLVASELKPAVVLDVYKSPTCSCCEGWITHLEDKGLQTRIHHPDDFNRVKRQYRITPDYQSCHTAVSADGYVFEGHIPAWVIKRFLAERPKDTLGLAVPGMPIGSPGMEMGTRFVPYDVLLLGSDGSSSVYIRINNLQESIQEE